MDESILLTLSQVLDLAETARAGTDWLPDGWTWDSQSQVVCNLQQSVRAQREWTGAIAALNQLLLELCPDPSTHSPSSPLIGLVLSASAPILNDPDLSLYFPSWFFTPHPVGTYQLQLPPASPDVPFPDKNLSILPLLPDDPLVNEQFCLVLTQQFGLVMTLGSTYQQGLAFQFSFDPDVVEQAYRVLYPRILLTGNGQVSRIEQLVDQFLPCEPNYRVVTKFSRLLLRHLPDPPKEAATKIFSQPQSQPFRGEEQLTSSRESPIAEAFHISSRSTSPGEAFDMELLQAIAHEVRTPLTTIRTLTRLLMKRKDLSPEALKRLEAIDRECSEQIDRFGLIFQAVELTTTATKQPVMPLASTSLEEVFQQSIPRWQKQASQSSLTLDVVLPRKMPTVVSHPALLDQVLTSLIERLTHSLPIGSHIQVKVMLAGSQLKVQLQTESDPLEDTSLGTAKSGLKSLGQLLMLQPETGNLSLNLAVTKNLFHALGGKLIVKQHPDRGEILTVFLPLETGSAEIYEV